MSLPSVSYEGVLRDVYSQKVLRRMLLGGKFLFYGDAKELVECELTCLVGRVLVVCNNR